MDSERERHLFLDVSRSFSNRAWVDRLNADRRRDALAIAEHHQTGELLSRVLAARGIGSAQAGDFLQPTLRALMPDPSALAEMDAAADRLADAIEQGETVAVFGDYDVDGACSAAQFDRYFAHFGLAPHIHIPDRLGEGYGPNIPAIDALREQGATLLVTVDCGTMSHEALSHAQVKGMDVVVLDHHQTGDTHPPAQAFVNPNRIDDTSGLGHLCAAGVVFMALVATNRALRSRGAFNTNQSEPDLMDQLDLVALATICDVVPLIGLNRAFVSRGLEIARSGHNIGIRALSAVAGLSGTPTPYQLGFALGPRINAGGRVGNAAMGAALLATHDPNEAEQLSRELDQLNRERQAMEQAAVAEAIAEAEAAFNEDTSNVVITSSPEWHPGIVGLVAARLKERFHRPAIALATGMEPASGSARSIPGVDIGAAIRDAVSKELLIKGGGHAMAAGLTVETGRIGDLRTYLGERLRDEVAERRGNDMMIDGALSASAATIQLVQEIARAEPYGSGNAEPVFVLPMHRLDYAEATKQGHIRIRISSGGARLSGIAFRAVDTPLGDELLARRGQSLHFAGTLRIDRWQGRETVSLHLRDAAKVDNVT